MAMSMTAGATWTENKIEADHSELQEFMYDLYAQDFRNGKVEYSVIDKEGNDFTNNYYDTTAEMFEDGRWDDISAYNFKNVDSIVKTDNRAMDVTKSKIQYASLICNPITDVSKYDYIIPKVIFKVTGNYAFRASITYNPNTHVISSYTLPVVIEQNFVDGNAVSGTIRMDSMSYSSQQGYPKLNDSKTSAQFQIRFHLWAEFTIAEAVLDRIDYGQRTSPICQIDAQ